MKAKEAHLPDAVLVQDSAGRALPAAARKHLRGCPSCTRRLAALSRHARSLGRLTTHRARPALRGRILGAAHDAAWRSCRQLLLELFCACLRLDPALAPRVALLRVARPWARVRADVQALAARLEALGLRPGLDGIPLAEPTQSLSAPAQLAGSSILATAARIGERLAALDPDPLRNRLVLAILDACVGREVQAAAALEQLLALDSDQSARRNGDPAAVGSCTAPTGDPALTPCIRRNLELLGCFAAGRSGAAYQPTAAPSFLDSLAPR